MKPAQAELARLRHEVIKLKAERGIFKKPRPTSRRRHCEVRLHREAPGSMAGGMLCEALGGSGTTCSSRALPVAFIALSD
jgi:hypothetical protein